MLKNNRQILLPDEYPYFLVLTHDIDRMSSREVPLWPKFMGHIYRLLKSRFKNQGTPVPLSERIADVIDMIKSRMRLGDDPVLQTFHKMINIERDFGVRSTIFIVVKPFICGLVNPFIQRFYKSRAVFYHFTDYIPLFRDLISEGWELGVHGIDAWASVENARQELEIFQKNFSQTRVGIRMHYLYQMPETSIWLEEAGFAYDSTVGSNYTANIPGGRITPYIPPGCHKFWEFPIIIQDQTVYAPAYSKVGYDTSRRMIDELLKYFRKYHGVMTILWHPDSFTAPNNWSGLYEYILQETSKDGAWIGSIGALLNKTK